MAKDKFINVRQKRYRACVFQVLTRDIQGQPKQCVRIDENEVVDLEKIRNDTGKTPEFIIAYVNEDCLTT